MRDNPQRALNGPRMRNEGGRTEIGKRSVIDTPKTKNQYTLFYLNLNPLRPIILFYHDIHGQKAQD